MDAARIAAASSSLGRLKSNREGCNIADKFYVEISRFDVPLHPRECFEEPVELGRQNQPRGGEVEPLFTKIRVGGRLRFVISRGNEDTHIHRRHIRLVSVGPTKLRVTNIGPQNSVGILGQESLSPEQSREFELPVMLQLCDVAIKISSNLKETFESLSFRSLELSSAKTASDGYAREADAAAKSSAEEVDAHCMLDNSVIVNSTGDRLYCSAFAPAQAALASTLLVQVFVHEKGKYDEARLMATEFDADASRRGRAALSQLTNRGDTLSFDLLIRGAAPDEVRKSLVWNGETDSVGFLVTVENDVPSGAVSGKVLIGINTVPVAEIPILIRIADGKNPGLIPRIATTFQSYFVSYASEDRSRVSDLMRMVKLLGKSYRQDIIDLDPGDRWRLRLYEFIRECDAMLLFWSSHAKQSEEVRQECLYCIEQKGIDRIISVVIERPVWLKNRADV